MCAELHASPAPDRWTSLDSPRLVVMDLGQRGVRLIVDALEANYHVTALGEDAGWIREVVRGLSANDWAAGVLRRAMRRGRCLITGDSVACAGLGVAICPLSAAAPETDAEVAAAALAPYLRAGALVILEGDTRLRQAAEVFSATAELLTPLQVGRDVSLGYVMEDIDLPGCVVSGVDPRSADRTEEFYRGLNRSVSAVGTFETAELAIAVRNALRAQAEGDDAAAMIAASGRHPPSPERPR
jgi:UDP-N-acetyl-D-mannosaminuronate dehydrogenase